ncbi:HAMP domain-containing protein [bacterium]|jgi:PAS domain S-box-containing protein|nr:HAMP domain-containing protein [bacterium]
MNELEKKKQPKRQSIQKKILMPFICIIILFVCGIIWLSFYLIKDHQKQQSLSEIEQVYQGLNERIQSTAILSNSEATALYEIQKLPYRRARDLYKERLAALQKKGTSVYFGANDLGAKQTLLKPFIQEGLKKPLFKIIINQKDNKIDSFIATISPYQEEDEIVPIITTTPLERFINNQENSLGYFIFGNYENKPFVKLIQASKKIKDAPRLQHKLKKKLMSHTPRESQFISTLTLENTTYTILFKEIDKHPHIFISLLHPVSPFSVKLIKFISLTILGILLLTFWTLTIYSMIIKKITSSIDILGAVADQVSDGDLEQHIYVDSNDEIGDLASIFNNMIKNLKLSSKTIIEEKNRSEAILSCLPEGIVVTDTENNIILANSIAESIFKFSFSDVQGKQLLENIKDVHLKKVMVEKFTNKQTYISKEVSIQDTDNKTKMYNLVSNKVMNLEKKGIGVITVLRDITHEKELENLREGFLRTVSHELRTPLTSVIGFLELTINSNNNLPEQIGKYMNIAYNEAKSLQSLIDDLLDLSRISAGKIHMHYSKCSSKDLLEGIVNSFTPLAKRKNLTLIHTLEKDILIEADEGKLRRILINLVSNAIKFTEKGTIELSVQETGDALEFSTKDSGIGLLKHEKDVIFEKFRQVDYSSTRKFEGIGLGLSIVKQLVNLHKGEISVKSEYRKGTTFIVSIPKEKPKD